MSFSLECVLQSFKPKICSLIDYCSHRSSSASVLYSMNPDKIQRIICNGFGPQLASHLQQLSYCCFVAVSLNIFTVNTFKLTSFCTSASRLKRKYGLPAESYAFTTGMVNFNHCFYANRFFFRLLCQNILQWNATFISSFLEYFSFLIISVYFIIIKLFYPSSFCSFTGVWNDLKTKTICTFNLKVLIFSTPSVIGVIIPDLILLLPMLNRDNGNEPTRDRLLQYSLFLLVHLMNHFYPTIYFSFFQSLE